jgi:predicted component of type VI protein secretion system
MFGLDFQQASAAQCIKRGARLCFHGSFRASKYFGYLPDGEVREIPKDERRPLPFWQARNRASNSKA